MVNSGLQGLLSISRSLGSGRIISRFLMVTWRGRLICVHSSTRRIIDGIGGRLEGASRPGIRPAWTMPKFPFVILKYVLSRPFRRAQINAWLVLDLIRVGIVRRGVGRHVLTKAVRVDLLGCTLKHRRLGFGRTGKTCGRRCRKIAKDAATIVRRRSDKGRVELLRAEQLVRCWSATGPILARLLWVLGVNVRFLRGPIVP